MRGVVESVKGYLHIVSSISNIFSGHKKTIFLVYNHVVILIGVKL